MNLEDLWKQHENTGIEISDLLQTSHWKKGGQAYPLKKIKRNLLYSLPVNVLISLIYVYVIFKFDFWPSQIGLALLLAFNCWAFFNTMKIYRSIPEQLLTHSSLHETLLVTFQTLRKWIRNSEYTGVLIYPIALTSGFLLGGWEGSGLPMEEFMAKPFVLIVFALSMAFLIPLCFITTRVLFRFSYGKYLKQLEKNIGELNNS